MHSMLQKLNQSLNPEVMSGISPHIIRGMANSLNELSAGDPGSLRLLLIEQIIHGMIEMLNVYQAKRNTLTSNNINACLEATFYCMIKFYYDYLPPKYLKHPMTVLAKNFKTCQINAARRELDFYTALSFDIPLRGGAREAPSIPEKSRSSQQADLYDAIDTMEKMLGNQLRQAADKSISYPEIHEWIIFKLHPHYQALCLENTKWVISLNELPLKSALGKIEEWLMAPNTERSILYFNYLVDRIIIRLTFDVVTKNNTEPETPYKQNVIPTYFLKQILENFTQEKRTAAHPLCRPSMSQPHLALILRRQIIIELQKSPVLNFFLYLREVRAMLICDLHDTFSSQHVRHKLEDLLSIEKLRHAFQTHYDQTKFSSSINTEIYQKSWEPLSLHDDQNTYFRFVELASYYYLHAKIQESDFESVESKKRAQELLAEFISKHELTKNSKLLFRRLVNFNGFEWEKTLETLTYAISCASSAQDLLFYHMIEEYMQREGVTSISETIQNHMKNHVDDWMTSNPSEDLTEKKLAIFRALVENQLLLNSQDEITVIRRYLDYDPERAHTKITMWHSGLFPPAPSSPFRITPEDSDVEKSPPAKRLKAS